MPADAPSNKPPLLIKKYSNRRLYDTETSSYITLEDLCQMVKKGVEFVVKDAKTGQDLTRLTLTQIIFEQESKGYNLLPPSFLRQIICFYDDSLGSVLSEYLHRSMQSFTQNQQQMRDYLKNPLQNFTFMKGFDDITKQNMQLFEKTLETFANMTSTNKKKDT